MNNYGMQPPPGYVYAGGKMFPSFALKVRMEREKAEAAARFAKWEEEQRLHKQEAEWEERYYEFQKKMLEYAASKLQDFLTSRKWPKLAMCVAPYDGEIGVRVPNKKYADVLMDFLTKKTGAISVNYEHFYTDLLEEYHQVIITIKPYCFVG